MLPLTGREGGCLCYNTQIHSWANATGIFTKIQPNTNTALLPLTRSWEKGRKGACVIIHKYTAGTIDKCRHN